MPALAAHDLRKSFGPQTVLDGASFSLARGERVGLIGMNGTGKSTLARILAGQEVADDGTVSVRRGLTVAYLAQEPELDPERSARQVVEDALTAWRAATARHAEVTARLSEIGDTPARAAEHDALLHEQAELDDAVHRFGGWDRGHVALDVLHELGVADVDRPVGARSGGERRRIALARILVARPDVAILDEPTNHLDADTAEWLEDHLANEYLGAIVLVTHDRYFLDAIVDRIVELERGTLTPYVGGYSDYLAKKAELMAHEERVEQNRQNILRREREWLSRGPKARATKQKARIQRAHALEAEGSATAGRPGDVTLTASASRQGKTLLEFRAVEIAVGGRTLIRPFDLVLTPGERVGVIGPNGVGKTTLLRAITGALAPIRGEVMVGKNTSIAYLDQARGDLDDRKSIFDDVRGELGGTVVQIGGQTFDLRTYLELFLFDPSKQRQLVGALSGGERARVALAKILKRNANLLLFDEPTNDLDLPTLGALEELLIGYDGSAIVVTHDRAFLDRVATSILSFEPGGPGEPATLERHAGGWQDYLLHKRSREDARRAEEAERGVSRPSEKPRGGAPRDVAPGPPKKGLTYGERIELEGIVAEIDAAEQRVRAIEAELADPSLYASRGAEVVPLMARLEAARSEASRLVTRWEELESRRS